MEYITKSQVAKRYGFDLKSVTNWMNERGADSCWSTDKRKFREPEITEWVIKNIITPLREVDNKELMDQAKLRKLDAEARIVEMTAREKANSLIPVELVEASVSKFSSMVRTSMLQIATIQTQQILEAATDTRTLKGVLAEIINERLNEVGQVMKSGKFLDDEEITQYSEDEDHNDGHITDDSTIEHSVSDDNDSVNGVSDIGSDPDDSNPDFFED
ncbi:hypothetical protein ACR3BZ_000028 [Enterobacter hormaechei]|uniref:hypothetical protein n=1 Tax=Enterobacter hormaechei TaxID=158836 RepID=UPI0012570F0F|nr:hypothetical protein [Enterobacter hormaechei]VAC85693.1 Uncharacterised protein [Enterobacter cloacae]VAM09213.1 Uncharacterised protein [Enterobacter kobei]MBK4612287.1 hypothetical protein [Enterobacter hormaechei]MBK4640684.1 hypothetical protein [Enterobacter hormaechei]MCF2345573.1 hypothetical protein [Enterobacter hormaechei]